MSNVLNRIVNQMCVVSDPYSLETILNRSDFRTNINNNKATGHCY